MLIEKARKYYDVKCDFNCAEAMIYAANEEYDLNLHKKTFKTMAPFGGGMGIESVCGAITGSIAVLGIMFTNERGHKSPQVKELCQEFFQKFKVKLHTDNCCELKEKYRNDDIRCSLMIDTAAEILDEIIERELK